MSPDAPLLELQQIQVAYGDQTVLDLEQFQLARGDSVVLLGHNGSGKSTLLRVMGLLKQPSRGRVLLDGRPVPRRGRGLLRARRRFASVLQEPLLCRTTVFKNVAQGLRFRRLPKPEIERRVGRWMEALRISHLRERNADTLSGGEAQRTSVARAMAVDPELLLLDEPFAALDAPTRAALMIDFRSALEGSPTAAVFATHDRNEALAIADRVAVLSAGRLLQAGAPEEVFGRPASEEVARFVGTETLIAGRASSVRDGVVEVETEVGLLHVADTAVAGPVFVCIRPENVLLQATADRPRQSARNTLSGRVLRIRKMEWHLQVTVDCGTPVTALITRSALEELEISEGTKVWAIFKATAAHLIPRR